MTRVGSILELPFLEQPFHELLGFDPEGKRESVNLEDTRFGWCRPERIWLHAAGGAAGDLVEVRRPLLLALHSADDGPALPDDIVLEFVLGEDSSVAAPLSLFLERWLPKLAAADGPPDGAPIVLALCNPHRARLTAPAAAAGRVVHYAEGDVDSWIDLEGASPPPLASASSSHSAVRALLARRDLDDAAGGRIRLVAPRWRRANDRSPPRE